MSDYLRAMGALLGARAYRITHVPAEPEPVNDDDQTSSDERQSAEQ